MSDAIDPDFAGLTAAVPGLPRDEGGPVFHEPWEAQAFAMTLALYRRGLFTWPEWAAALGAEIKRAQEAGDPDTRRHLLPALARRRWNGWSPRRAIADPASLARYRDAWDRAADRTPHGMPIELQPEDFAEAEGKRMAGEHEEEFAAAVRRAGVAIPPERWEIMRDAYASMQKLLSVLSEPLAYEDEPAVLPI